MSADPPPETIPYTMQLPDGRSVYIEVPAHMASKDRDGSVLFTPEGVEFLDQVRAVAGRSTVAPSPGYIASARRALGLTQAQLAKRLGRSTITVKRWETGTLRPGRDAVQKLQRLLDKAAERGVVLPG